MANQRMRIKCDHCGGELGFAKRMGRGFYIASYIKGWIEEEMNDFFDAHEECKPDNSGYSWDHFSIAYEHERENGK